MASTKLLGYGQGLTGGGANDLDNIAHSTMESLDPTFIITTGDARSIYWFQYTSGNLSTEYCPKVIKPDDGGSSGSHILVRPYRPQFIENCTGAVSPGASDLGGHITYTNYGASSSLVKISLPVGSTGLKTTLIQMSCGKFSAVANTSEYFRQDQSESAKGSKLESTSIGNAVTFTFGGNNRWIIHPVDGVWQYET